MLPVAFLSVSLAYSATLANRAPSIPFDSTSSMATLSSEVTFATSRLERSSNSLLMAQAITPATNDVGTIVMPTGNQIDITGGQFSGDGANLFHSFEQFGLSTGQTANFMATPQVQNVLSAVLGGNVSYIDGILQVSNSDANLYLINPAGVIFGANAGLNLNGDFTVTTADRLGFGDRWLDIFSPGDYQDLLGTPDQFVFSTAQPASILNLGNLAVDQGNSLTVLGGNVVNLGELLAPEGAITVLSVPGENLVRISQDNTLLSLDIEALDVTKEFPTLDPLTLPDLLTGGWVDSDNLALLTAPDGTVHIQTLSGGTVASGQINTAGDFGGQINLLGDQVSLLSADINASGNLGGGIIRIGGDYQGTNTLPQSTITTVDEFSNIVANATQIGDGGTIIVWSDLLTTIDGFLSAQGGSDVGNGGFIETSGAQLKLTQTPDASAINGSGGLWLIDPVNITIVSDNENGGSIGATTINVENINDALEEGMDVLITTGTTGNDVGDITQQTGATIRKNDGPEATLTLQAANNIWLNDNIQADDFGGLTLNLIADLDNNGLGGVIANPGMLLETNGGDVNTSGASLRLGTIDTSSFAEAGQVNLTSASDIVFGLIDARGEGDADAGNVALTANGVIRGTRTIDSVENGFTINTTGFEKNGTVRIQHNGGPNNVPFIVGDSSENGTAGAIVGSIEDILDNGIFPVLPNGGSVTPRENVTIASTNSPPTLTINSQLSNPFPDQPLNFTVADLNPVITDIDNDITTLQVASIAAGTLLRNGIAVQPGETILPTDILQFILPADASVQLTAFTLQATDGVSSSATVPVSVVGLDISSILDPTISVAATPFDLSAVVKEQSILTGIYLPQSPILEELTVVGSMLPEPSLFIFDLPSIDTGFELYPPEDIEAGVSSSDIPEDLGHPNIPEDPGHPNMPTDAVYPDVPENPDQPNIPAETSQPDTPGNTVAIRPDEGIDRTSAITAGFKNCQAEVKAIESTPARDRTQPVYQSLIDCHQENLTTSKEQNNLTWAAYSLNNLAISHFVMGDYLTALDFHQQQLEQASALNDRTQQGIALGGIGAVYAALGDHATAIDYYQRSLDSISVETAPQWKALTYRNLGNAYFAETDYDQAADYQLRSLDISRSINDRYGEMQAYSNLGHTYTIQADFANSIDFYEKGLTLANDLNNSLERTQILLGLSTTYAYQQDYDQAYRYAKQSLELSQELGARLGEGIALTNMGQSLLYLSRLSEAETTLLNAITIWESLRAGLGTNDAFKVSLFETQLAAYRNLKEVLVGQNKLETALEISERGRARAFVELIARGAVDPNQAGDSMPPSVEQIRQIAKTQNATLVEYAIIREQVVDSPHGVSVQTTIDSQDVQLYVWVVQPTGDVAFRQVNLASLKQDRGFSLAELIQTSRALSGVRGISGNNDVNTLGVNNVGFASRLSQPQYWRQLHQLLIEPIADLLPTDPEARVFFIPQEQLFLVPFPALQAADGSRLIDHHTILTAPAIQVLALTNRDRTPSDSQPLVVGNPSPMPDENLIPLPHAGTEADGIAQLLSTRPLIGDAATETAIKQQLATAPLIHLATHGFFDEQQPLQGALAFAPSDHQDGFLTAEEILAQSLIADLVVLSACDTGRGKITGDGVIGLSRSFLAAGANNVMVSLWQVPDDATAQLMIEFYRQRQHMDNAQALRQAMLATRQIYKDPTAWAAFTLIGAIE